MIWGLDPFREREERRKPSLSGVLGGIGRSISEFLGSLSPKMVSGIITLSMSVPIIMIAISATSVLVPQISQAIGAIAPLIAIIIPIMIVITIFSVFIGVIRRVI